jgi:thiol-disulfide isomerase/thioredoxin
VESAQRAERLWIGQDSGRVRGVLSYRFTGFAGWEAFFKTDTVQRIAGQTFASPQAYGTWLTNEASEDQLRQISLAWWERCSLDFPTNARPNELVQFDDYREVAPGVWLPFREVRTFPHASETEKGKSLLRRSELLVEEVRTDLDLANRYAQLLPREGQRVQDQRFSTPVNYDYRADRPDEDIRQQADAEYRKQLEGQEVFQRLVQPLEAMVGRPAPALPAAGWIGGPRPDVAGKPYLLRFWATSCGPCKSDLPSLQNLAERGAVIVGMHPSGTPAEEVEKVLRDQSWDCPTFLSPGGEGDASPPKIGGYPVGVFPYYILVDAQGRVAGHGFLSELREKFGEDALIAPRKDDA